MKISDLLEVAGVLSLAAGLDMTLGFGWALVVMGALGAVAGIVLGLVGR